MTGNAAAVVTGLVAAFMTGLMTGFIARLASICVTDDVIARFFAKSFQVKFSSSLGVALGSLQPLLSLCLS